MINRIDSKFQWLRNAGKTALIPYVTVGFPDVGTSEKVAEVLMKSGGDILELGVPFSDPLADGPTIQKTSFQALGRGVNLVECLDFVRRLRSGGIEAPLVSMGYYNPFFQYGIERFGKDASAAGLDGLIVPDLPPEEAAPFRSACKAKGMHLIPLLAPTSSDERIALSCREAGGFIYCVSLTGVTGARQMLASGLPELVGRIRRHTDLPVVVGFGVSRREHVEEISRFADGAVFASALMDAVDRSPKDRAVEVAADFVKTLRGSRQPGQQL